MNKNFNTKKNNIDNIIKDFSNEGIVNLINEFERNTEKEQ